MGKQGFPGVRLLSVAALACWAGAAQAQTRTDATYGGAGGDWSATAARTVPPGQNVLQLEAGWPGVSLAFLHGQTRSSDIGGRLSFLYGFEGTTRTIAGVQFQVPYRRLLLGGADFASLAVHVDPGFTVYWHNADRGGTEPGIGGPIGLVAGFRIDSRLTLEAGADFPIFLSFIHPLGLFLGPQLGGGAEYHIQPNVAVTLRARFGPNFAAANGDTSTKFAFSTLLGLAYNMR
jgi:hypothetical protein